MVFFWTFRAKAPIPHPQGNEQLQAPSSKHMWCGKTGRWPEFSDPCAKPKPGTVMLDSKHKWTTLVVDRKNVFAPAGHLHAASGYPETSSPQKDPSPHVMTSPLTCSGPRGFWMRHTKRGEQTKWGQAPTAKGARAHHQGAPSGRENTKSHIHYALYK